MWNKDLNETIACRALAARCNLLRPTKYHLTKHLRRFRCSRPVNLARIARGNGDVSWKRASIFRRDVVVVRFHDFCPGIISSWRDLSAIRYSILARWIFHKIGLLLWQFRWDTNFLKSTEVFHFRLWILFRIFFPFSSTFQLRCLKSRCDVPRAKFIRILMAIHNCIYKVP